MLDQIITGLILLILALGLTGAVAVFIASKDWYNN
jgi:ABC-type uncharacterized transport system permease subunit